MDLIGPNPARTFQLFPVTVTVVAIDYSGNKPHVLLVEYADQQTRGLPCRVIPWDRTIEQTAIQALHDQTGLECDKTYHIGVYDAVDRQPGGRVISHACAAFFDSIPNPTRGMWVHRDAAKDLIYDHEIMIRQTFELLHALPRPEGRI